MAERVNISGMYRSGSTLLFALTCRLREKFNLDINVTKEHKYTKKFDKIIYSYRDVRDVIVSLMEMKGLEFDNFVVNKQKLKDFLATITTHDRNWRNEYKGRCLLLEYESEIFENDIELLLEKIIRFLDAEFIFERENYKNFVKACKEDFHISKIMKRQEKIKVEDKYHYHHNQVSKGGSKLGKWKTSLNSTQKKIVNDYVCVRDFLDRNGYEL